MTAVAVPKLTPRERRILDVLKEAGPGVIVSFEELCSQLFGSITRHNVWTLRTHVAYARRKLGSEAITSVRGEGYALGSVHSCEACNGSGFVVN